MTDERKAEIRKQIEDLVTGTIDNMGDSEMINLWIENLVERIIEEEKDFLQF